VASVRLLASCPIDLVENADQRVSQRRLKLGDASVDADAGKCSAIGRFYNDTTPSLLVFYDFPAEHWKHLRTTNVIKSSFATVRHLAQCQAV
jgi:transposase-like protein